MKTNLNQFIYEQIQEKLPEGLKPFHREAHNFGQNLLRRNGEQLGLVSREEFLAQQQLLQRALERIVALEQQLAEKNP